jgi:hypothetical protein
LTNATLARLIERYARRYGSLSALGKAIGLSPSRMSRLSRGDQGSLEVLNCLKLADLMAESPDTILRAAGKADVADLIARLYQSTGQAPALPPTLAAVFERVTFTHTQIAEFLDVWARLKDDARDHWWELIKASAEEADRERGVTNGPRPISATRDPAAGPVLLQTPRRRKRRL